MLNNKNNKTIKNNQNNKDNKTVKTIKTIKTNKNKKKGFTLIELLVVVVIIAVLAAIALPQYKKVVIKSKFATLKENTESLAKAVDRYFLTYNDWPTTLNDLDIELGTVRSNNLKVADLEDGSHCFFSLSSYRMGNVCRITIFGKQMSYQVFTYSTGRKLRYCLASSTDTSDIYNQLCQQETGKKTPSSTESTLNSYTY